MCCKVEEGLWDCVNCVGVVECWWSLRSQCDPAIQWQYVDGRTDLLALFYTWQAACSPIDVAF